jgi:hypothetical protein
MSILKKNVHVFNSKVADFMKKYSTEQITIAIIIFLGIITSLIQFIYNPNGNNPILKLIEKLSPYHRRHEERSFSSRTLKKWCKEAGYEVERLNYVGFVPFFFPALPAKIIYFFQPFMEKIYPLKKYFGAQIIILCRKKTVKQ